MEDAESVDCAEVKEEDIQSDHCYFLCKSDSNTRLKSKNPLSLATYIVEKDRESNTMKIIPVQVDKPQVTSGNTDMKCSKDGGEEHEETQKEFLSTGSVGGNENVDKPPAGDQIASVTSKEEKQKIDSVLETGVIQELTETKNDCPMPDNRDNKKVKCPSANLELKSEEKITNEENNECVAEVDELSDFLKIHSTACIDVKDFDAIPASCKTLCFSSSDESEVPSLKRKFTENDKETDTSENDASSSNKSAGKTMKIDERNVSDSREMESLNNRILECNSCDQSGEVTGMVLECEEEEFEHNAALTMEQLICNEVDKMVDQDTDTPGDGIVAEDVKHGLCIGSLTENRVEGEMNAVAMETVRIKEEQLNLGYACDAVQDQPERPICDNEYEIEQQEMADYPPELAKGKSLLDRDIKMEPELETVDATVTAKMIVLDTAVKDSDGNTRSGQEVQKKIKKKRKKLKSTENKFQSSNLESIMERAVKQLKLDLKDGGVSAADRYRSSTIKPIVYTTVLKTGSTGPSKAKKVQYVHLGDSIKSGESHLHKDESTDDVEDSANNSRNLTKLVDHELDEKGEKMEMYLRDVAEKSEARLTASLQQNVKNPNQKLMLVQSSNNNLKQWRYFSVKEKEKEKMPMKKYKPLKLIKTTTTEKSKPVLLEYVNKNLQLQESLQSQKSATVGSSTKFIVPLNKTQQQLVGTVPVVKILKVKEEAKTYNSTTKTLVPMQDLPLEDVSQIKVFPVDQRTKTAADDTKKIKVFSVGRADGKLVVKDVQKTTALSNEAGKVTKCLPMGSTPGNDSNENVTQCKPERFDPSKLKPGIYDINKFKALKSRTSKIQASSSNTSEVASKLKPGIYNINEFKSLTCTGSNVRVGGGNVSDASVDLSKMKPGISNEKKGVTITSTVTNMGGGDATVTGGSDATVTGGGDATSAHLTVPGKDNSCSSEITDNNLNFNSLAEAMKYFTSNGKKIKVVSIRKKNPVVSPFPQSGGLPGSILSKLTDSSSEQCNIDIIPIPMHIGSTTPSQQPGTTTSLPHPGTTIPKQQPDTTISAQHHGTTTSSQHTGTTIPKHQSGTTTLSHHPGTTIPTQQSGTTSSSQQKSVTSSPFLKKEVSDSSIEDSDFNTVSKPDDDQISSTYTDPVLKGNIFSCSSCLFETHSMNLFARHKSQGCGTSDSEFTRNKTCHACGHEFTNLRDRMAHLELHSKNTGLEISHHCFICWKGYRTKEELGLHFEFKHNCKFTCNVCGKECATETEYEQHLQRQHPDHDFYKCDQCESRFNCARGLKVHKRVSHGLHSDFISKCDICGKEFNKAFKLKEHYKTHTGEKPYECCICKKRFRCNAFLTRHIRVHTGEKPYQCPKCPKAFSCYAALFRHDNVHTGKRPYICHICGKGFKAGSTLTNHHLTHSGIKRFKCSYCGKAFAFKKTKELHELTHMKSLRGAGDIMDSAKRKHLTLSEKMKVIDLSKSGLSSRKIANKLHVGRTQIQSILKRKAELIRDFENDVNPDRKRKARVTGNEKINKLCWQWFKDATSRKINVTGSLLQKKAIKFAKDIGNDKFRASNGWLNSFRQRHNVVFATMSGKRGNVVNRAVAKWKSDLTDLCRNYHKEDVFVLNEMRLFYRDTLETLHLKVEECVSERRSKEQITVALCASMTGEKMKPLVIGKAQQPRCFEKINPGKLPVTYQFNSKAQMNSRIFEEWLRQLDRKMQVQGRSILLFINNSSSHPEITLKNIRIKCLPSSMESESQPMDMGIIQATKLKFRKKQLQHVICEMDRTPGVCGMDVLRQISILDTVYWISQSWRDVEPETIKKCFVKAGFVLNTPDKHDATTKSIQDPLSDDSDDDLPPAVVKLSRELFGCEFHDLVKIDESVKMCKQLQTNSDLQTTEILQDTINTNSDTEVCDAEDDDISQPEVCSVSDAHVYIMKLKEFAESQGYSDLLSSVMDASDVINSMSMSV